MRSYAARSDAQGTTLPRAGFFPGVHAPRYRTAVIEGELPGPLSGSDAGTQGWAESNEHQITQTPAASAFTSQLLTAYWSQATIPAVRSSEVAYAFLSRGNEPTESPWQQLRHVLQPLRPAADALLEDIHDTLQSELDSAARTKHAGLTAVARLVDVLGLSRPTILRMGGVPTSTFYAWQKSPRSVIRTPTIARLLRLQAQVAILDEALGRDRMRSWILSADRLDRLQGDEAAFGQVLAEAQTSLTEATRILPRPRMRGADYASDASEMADEPAGEPSTWPGAVKILEEETDLSDARLIELADLQPMSGLCAYAAICPMTEPRRRTATIMGWLGQRGMTRSHRNAPTPTLQDSRWPSLARATGHARCLLPSWLETGTGKCCKASRRPLKRIAAGSVAMPIQRSSITKLPSADCRRPGRAT